MFVIGLLFAGLTQVSRIFAAKEVLEHAAACGARAKTVGFNRWMVEKVIRVAAIPNAGKLVAPSFENADASLRQMVATLKPGDLWTEAISAPPTSLQYGIERGRIPEYLASENDARASYTLDYEDWDTIRSAVEGEGFDPGLQGAGNPLVRVTTEQDYPLLAPLHRAFYAADAAPLSGESRIENHYPLYLDDLGL